MHKILVEEKFDTKVTLSGIGEAITNVVNIAELVRHRIKGIHSICDIISVSDDSDTQKVLFRVTLSLMTINKFHPGYSAPPPDHEV